MKIIYAITVVSGLALTFMGLFVCHNIECAPMNVITTIIVFGITVWAAIKVNNKET